MNSEQLWNAYKEKNGLSKELKYLDSFHFELTEYWANKLLELVLEGVKKATSSSVWGYEIEGDRIPQKGDYSIVTDWDGNARCVIQTTNVRIIPFKDITYDICKLEGEDDNLESWRKGHISFFQAEGKELGYEFTEEMPVIFEEFEVVYSC
ncbi:MAG: ASCH domain-containing protein [Lachnospiraceae bacterium]|nr:ASCH domain-containing protein [Lachnospiraceae bacterium]